MELPDEAAVESLADRLRGRILNPGDRGYAEARSLWNARFDRYPSYIIRCRSPADVVAGVDFARENDLRLTVKAGGHDYAAHAARNDAVLIDLTQMDSVRIDPDARRARVGPGVTWAEFDQAAQQFGLATTGATVSTVGVAGYTLGGGTGHLARTHGLSIDNLRSVDVVTADGDHVRAGEDDHPDLFWAVRGGSGNFGIVTSFEFDLHPVGPEVLAGQLVYPFGDATAVLNHYRSYMADASPAVNCYAFIVRIPPRPAFDEALHGAPAVNLVACYSGDIETGEPALEPLREFGDPILDSIRPQPYTELQQAFDDGVPKGERWHSKAQYLDELTDEAIDSLVAATDPLNGPLTMVYLEPMGGAIAEVAPDETAFPHRDATYSLHVLTGWSDPDRDDDLVDWTEAVHEAMEPYAAEGVYVNLLNRSEGARVPEAYSDNYERLREIKSRWDPENLFDANQNIEPAE